MKCLSIQHMHEMRRVCSNPHRLSSLLYFDSMWTHSIQILSIYFLNIRVSKLSKHIPNLQRDGDIARMDCRSISYKNNRHAHIYMPGPSNTLLTTHSG